MLTFFATSDEYHELSTNYASKKVAVNDRARFYHLRKIMAENAKRSGNDILAAKLYKVSMRLADSADRYTLTMFNQYSNVSDDLAGNLAGFLAAQGVSQPETEPYVPEADKESMAAYLDELRSRTADESDSAVKNYFNPED